jgi:hypothetical protein
MVELDLIEIQKGSHAKFACEIANKYLQKISLFPQCIKKNLVTHTTIVFGLKNGSYVSVFHGNETLELMMMKIIHLSLLMLT